MVKKFHHFSVLTLVCTLVSFAGLVLWQKENVVSFFRDVPAPHQAEAQTTADWPQLQHDASRSGYNNIDIRSSGAFQLKWVWHPSNKMTPMSEYAQPIVSAGIVAMGDFSGVMHALDEITGQERWAFPTGAPIYASAAIGNGYVYFGSQSGKIYAISVTTGQEVWSYQTGGGVVTAPLMFQNMIIMGSKDGKVYALRADSGTLVWTFDAKAPILMSAAASSDGKVFFGAENMKAYGLSSANGSLLWEKQLKGDGFRHLWPVVSNKNKVVFFRTEITLSFHDVLNAGGSPLANGRCGNFNFGECHPNPANCSLTCAGVSSIQSTESDYQSEQSRLTNYLASSPYEQTFFALDTQTGNEKYSAPVLYTGGMGNVPAPIVIDETNDRSWVIWRSYYSRYDSASTVRPFVDIGKLDLATGKISYFSCPNFGVESCKMAWEDLHLVGDEQSYLSAAKNAILVGNGSSLGGILLSTEKSFFGVSSNNAEYRKDLTLTNSSWPLESYADSVGNPIGVVANGRLFYKSGLLGVLQ